MREINLFKTGIDKQNMTVINKRELQRASSFISSEVGVHLQSKQRRLVETNIHKRIRELSFSDCSYYLDFTLDSPEGALEKLELIDTLINGDTGFYHEVNSFKQLKDAANIKIKQHEIEGKRQDFNVWSAGCSTGEEAYTIGLELSEIADKDSGFSFNILATDISHNNLSRASRGKYTEEQARVIPRELRDKYVFDNDKSHDDTLNMVPQIRRKIKFKYHNLKDEVFHLQNKMDVIFCRNVMSGFNEDLRSKLLSRFEDNLSAGGYLIIGDTESLDDAGTRLEKISPTMYQKQ